MRSNTLYCDCIKRISTANTNGGDSVISINYRDARPIYEQVRDSFLALILSDALAPGYKMPSVRELASTLAINPNTIQRAYRELENEGYIVSVPGKGSFCAQFSPQSDPRREELLARLEETVRELRWLGVSEEEIIEKIGGDGHGEH